MELWLTSGMFGRKTMKIAEADDSESILKAIDEWKNANGDSSIYKIEKYNRFIIQPSEKCTAIDFGDYRTFMLVCGDNFNAFDNVRAYED